MGNLVETPAEHFHFGRHGFSCFASTCMELIGPNSVRSDRYKGKRQKFSRAEGSSRSRERRNRVLTVYLGVRSIPLHLRCRRGNRLRCRPGRAREVYRSFRSPQKSLRNELRIYRAVSLMRTTDSQPDKGHALDTASRTDVSLLSPRGAPIPAIERLAKTPSVTR